MAENDQVVGKSRVRQWTRTCCCAVGAAAAGVVSSLCMTHSGHDTIVCEASNDSLLHEGLVDCDVILHPKTGRSKSCSTPKRGAHIASCVSPKFSMTKGDENGSNGRPHSSLVGSDRQSVRTITKVDVEELEFDKNKDKVGYGSTATVFSGKFKGGAVAIKVFKLKEKLEKELNVWSHIHDHKNMVPILAVFGLTDVASPRLGMVMGLCKKDLFQSVFEDKDEFTTPEAKHKIAECIVKGVKYLHSNSIIHRDLKHENILLEQTHDGVNARITDLDCAEILQPGVTTVEYSIGGTPEFMAPEQLRGERLSKAVDIWALANVLTAMFTEERFPPQEVTFGKPPGQAVLDAVYDYVVKNNKRPTIAPPIPATLVGTIKSSFSENAKDRPPIEEFMVAVSHMKRWQSCTFLEQLQPQLVASLARQSFYCSPTASSSTSSNSSSYLSPIKRANSNLAGLLTSTCNHEANSISSRKQTTASEKANDEWR